MPLRPFLRVLSFAALSQLVLAQTASTVSLSTSSDSTAAKGIVELIANVSPAGADGMVVFYDGSALVGTSPIVSGVARLFRPMSRGVHTLHAHYSGDGVFAPADSRMAPALISHTSTSRPAPRAGASSPLGPYLISTVAGGGLPTSGTPAIANTMRSPGGVVTDPAGNVYFADSNGNVVYRIDLVGNLSLVAGTGAQGFSGDNGPALSAMLDSPMGLALDTAGNLYIADAINARVRRVATDGIITTVAGTGACCSGRADSGAATAVEVGEPTGVATDSSGNLYIADPSSDSIRKVNTSGLISTVGNFLAYGVAADRSGNIYIPDTASSRIYEVSDGSFRAIAGTGIRGFSGDGQAASTAELSFPYATAVDSSGVIYVADLGNNRVRRIGTDGIITTVAGNGGSWFASDGVSPLAEAVQPQGVAVDHSGNVYVSDSFNKRVRVVSGGIIGTAAGGGSYAGPAAPASALTPTAIATDSAGTLYVGDSGRVYQVTASGALITIAGTGAIGYSGDKGAATAATIGTVSALAISSSGDVYIADDTSHNIRKVSGGIITTVFSGIGLTSGMVVDAQNNIFLADEANNCISEVTSGGAFSVVAGSPYYPAQYWGDGGSAGAALFNHPTGIAIDKSGNVYVADGGNLRVRRFTPGGDIVLIAGNGSSGTSGDGGSATGAEFCSLAGVAVDQNNNVYVSDSVCDQVRVVRNGIINTIAWGDMPEGDGLPALAADLGYPHQVASDGKGDIYFVDSNRNSVRLLTPENGPPLFSVTVTPSGSFQLGTPAQYQISVSNVNLAGATSAAVSVTELPPDALTISSMLGSGWQCSANVCTYENMVAGNSTLPPITAKVQISNTAPAQVTNVVTAGGGGAAGAVAVQSPTNLTAPATTIQTSPTRIQLSVDGSAPLNTPLNLNLSPGPHLLSAPATLSVSPAIRTVLSNWSDSGAATHLIEVTGSAAIYTATFKTQYQLTTAAFPAPGGTAAPASGFVDAGSSVSFAPTATAPYVFDSWSGDASGSTNPLSLTMNGPLSVIADFSVPGFTCAIATRAATPTAADIQFIINEALGTSQPSDDLDHDHFVTVADIQKVIQAALGTGCLY